MKPTAAPRVDVTILMPLLRVGAGAVVFASILYWMMQPTVLPNPGLAGYHAPTPDPIIPRIASRPIGIDTERAAIDFAKGQNESDGVGTPAIFVGEANTSDAKSAFAKALPKRRRTIRVRTARPRPQNS